MTYTSRIIDGVLDLWSAGKTDSQITDLMAERGYDLTRRQVRYVIQISRGKDPRAIRHHGNAVYGDAA